MALKRVSDELPVFFEALGTVIQRNDLSKEQQERNEFWIARIRNKIEQQNSLAKPAKVKFSDMG
jgi:hypothetical protein